MLWVIFLPYIVKTLKWYSLIDIIFFLLVAVTWKYTDIVKINPFVMTPGKESRELLQSRFMDFSYVSIWDFMCQNFVFLYLSAVCAHVGVEDPHIIPNAQITSSSYYLRYYPHIGRLNEVKGWCHRTTAITDDYIQVDMRPLHTVCAIATQGKKNGSFVKSYKLSFSTDESSWVVYQGQNIDKVWNNSTNLLYPCKMNLWQSHVSFWFINCAKKSSLLL